MPDEEVDQLLTQDELRLKAAQHLLMNEYYDDAVSRAYYSMYFAATALLLARNIQVRLNRKRRQNNQINVFYSYRIRVMMNY